MTKESVELCEWRQHEYVELKEASESRTGEVDSCCAFTSLNIPMETSCK
jgi:hypothetical protein